MKIARIDPEAVATIGSTKQVGILGMNESQASDFERAWGVVADAKWAFGIIRREMSGKPASELAELEQDLVDLIDGGMSLRNEVNIIVRNTHIRRMQVLGRTTGGHSIPATGEIAVPDLPSFNRNDETALRSDGDSDSTTAAI